MGYRRLGRAGVRVSVIGLGTNRFGTDKLPLAEVNKIVEAAVELGINVIDTANTYSLAGRRRPSLV
jgi:aryl-alcohol dehydrogenase-like predicted oxidoreductase